MKFDNPLSNLIGELFGKWLASKADAALLSLHIFLPEITTLFIVFCALCMMITGKSGKWFSRAVMGFWIAIVIKIV